MPIPDDLDTQKLAEVALALLYLGVHGEQGATRVWKSFDWDLTDLLYAKGWIADPKTKAKSVMLTEEGERIAEPLLRKHFS